MHYTTTHNFAKNDSKQPTFWNQFPPLYKQNHDYASEIASLRNWTRTRRNPTSCPFQQQNRENNSTGIKTRSGSSWLQRSPQVMAHRKVSADFAYTRTRHPCRRHLEKSIPIGRENLPAEQPSWAKGWGMGMYVPTYVWDPFPPTSPLRCLIEVGLLPEIIREEIDFVCKIFSFASWDIRTFWRMEPIKSVSDDFCICLSLVMYERGNLLWLSVFISFARTS